MAHYVWKDGHFRNHDGNPMPVPERGEVCCPQVMSDIPEYISPVTSKPITSPRIDAKVIGALLV